LVSLSCAGSPSSLLTASMQSAGTAAISLLHFSTFFFGLATATVLLTPSFTLFSTGISGKPSRKSYVELQSEHKVFFSVLTHSSVGD